MNRTNYYLVVFFSALAAFFLGVALLPTRQETSLMLYYDKQYEKAYSEYMELYNAGDHSIKVVMPLVWLEVESARIDRAIELMETFLKEHPQVPGGRDYLAELFLDANLMRNYVQTLDDSSIEKLRVKEKYYRNETDLPNRVEKLNLVSQSTKSTDEDYLMLAYLYALKGKNKEAEKTIEKMLNSFDLNVLNPDEINLALNILIDNNRYQKAYSLAKEYLIFSPNLDTLKGIERVLINADMFQEGLDLLDILPDWAKRSPEVLDIRLTLMLGKKDYFFSYELMRQHFAIGDLPKGQWENFLALAIEYRDETILESILNGGELDLYSESALLEIVAIGHANLFKNIPEEYRALGIAIALSDPKHDFEESLDITGLENGHKMFLAKLSQKREFKTFTRKLLESIDTFENIDTVDLSEIARLYQEMDLLDNALGIVDQNDQKELWFLLSVAAGNKEVLNDTNFDKEILEGAYWIASDQQDTTLAVALAEVFHKKFLSFESSKILGEAYLYNGEAAKAVPILQELYEENKENEALTDIYLEALANAKQEEMLSDVIAYVIPEESRLPRLKKFGKLMRDYGFSTIAEEIYLKAQGIEPSDGDILEALGMINYDKGKYCKAREYLAELLLQKEEPAYLPFYYYGMLLSLEEEKKGARPFFCYALKKMREGSKPDKQIEAQILYQLKCYNQAISLYKKMISEDPDNLFLRTDLANIFIDLECYTEAASILCNTDDLQMILTKVRLLTARDQLCRALHLSNLLLRQYPDSGLVYASRADLEYKMGRWRRSLSYVDRARTVEPENEIYCDQRNAILLNYLPDITLGGEYRKTGDTQWEHYIRFHYSNYLYPFTLFEFFAETDFIEVDAFTDIDDATISSIKRTRHRWEAALVYTCDSGITLKGSIYYSPELVGLGAIYERPDLKGVTFLVGEYNRPNWDFVETIIEHGSRDMVGISRDHIFFPRVQGSLGFSYNRYNLKGFFDAATSYAIEGELTYAFPTRKCLGEDTYLSLNYSLDAEYETHIRKRDGDFAPFPLSDRENHALTLFASKRWSKIFALEGYGGYIYDRVVGQKSVPIYGGSAILGREGCFDVRFLYSHSTSTETSGADVDRFVLDVKYVY